MGMYQPTLPLTFFQATELAKFILSCDRVPFLQGSPGIGKSAIAKEIAKQLNLYLIDIRLASLEPTDLNGYPFLVDGKLTHLPMDLLPVESDKIPTGYDGWLILFDELNSSDRSVQAAAYKPILDRMVNQSKLHPAVRCMAAGNYMADNAITNIITSAMVSRMTFLSVVADFKETMKHALANAWNPELLAFLSFKPEYLHNFDPDQEETPYSCPRTLETASTYANKMVQSGIPISSPDYLPVFAGSVGVEAASAFTSFTALALPNMKALLADPLGITINIDAAVQYSTAAMLTRNADDTNIGLIMKYVNRMMPEIVVVFLRMTFSQKPTLAANPEFMGGLTKFREELKQYV